MAKIVEHGKYWREDLKKAYKEVLVKCPECDNVIRISSYDIYISSTTEAWCECGCKFIPELADIVEA